jgi:hypothetical protein
MIFRCDRGAVCPGAGPPRSGTVSDSHVPASRIRDYEMGGEQSGAAGRRSAVDQVGLTWWLVLIDGFHNQISTVAPFMK